MILSATITLKFTKMRHTLLKRASIAGLFAVYATTLAAQTEPACPAATDVLNVDFAYRDAIAASTGVGAPLDHCRAASLYRYAAMQGHAGAQYGLAAKYINGWGEPRNDVLAYMWTVIALENPVRGHFIHDVGYRAIRILERDMSASQIAAALEATEVCVSSGYADCQ